MKKTMKASEFKAKCLQVMDEVAETGESVLITKNGNPVAELVPARHLDKPLFGALKGWITITGDIVSPIGEEWDAEKGILLREDDC